MTILHYIPSIDRSSGGVGSYLQLLAKELGQLCQLHVVTHRSDNELQIEHAKVHYIPRMSKVQMLWAISTNGYLCQIKEDFLGVLEEVKPDVVHCNACWDPMDAYTVIWAKRAGYKVALTPHGMLEPWDIRKNYYTKKLPAILLYQRQAVRQSDILIATAATEASNLTALAWNKRIAMLPNGVEVGCVRIKSTWQINKQIMMLGLLRPNKGASLLIEAIAALRHEFLGWKVLIAGPDTEGYAATLKSQIAHHGIEGIVLLVGAKSGEEKWDLYRGSDLFVLPTLNENFGIVIAESFLAGTPVITTKGAPWPEIEQENLGWWIDRSVSELVQALRSFLAKTPAELQAMGERGRKLVEEKYSAKSVAQQFMAMYEGLFSHEYGHKRRV